MRPPSLPWLLLCAALAAGCSRKDPAPQPKRPAIPRYDVHTHIGPLDVPKAREVQARHGIEGFVNLSGGSGRFLEAQLEAARPYGGKVVVFANLSNRSVLAPGWVEAQVQFLRNAKAAGVRGLKFYKALGLGWADPSGARVTVDDPRLDPIFEACAELGMPVSIHTGDPKAFFQPLGPDNERMDELSKNPGWSFADPPYPKWQQLFDEYERRVARHPRTTFIGVHFGNDPEDPERVAAMLRKYPNLFADTAARVPEIGRMAPEKLRALFVELHDRILFGTDFSYMDGEMTLGAPDGSVPGQADADRFFNAHWQFFETNDRKMAHPTPIQGRWTVDAIGLPEAVLHDLYHRNAERLLGLPPLGAAKP